MKNVSTITKAPVISFAQRSFYALPLQKGGVALYHKDTLKPDANGKVEESYFQFIPTDADGKHLLELRGKKDSFCMINKGRHIVLVDDGNQVTLAGGKTYLAKDGHWVPVA